MPVSMDLITYPVNYLHPMFLGHVFSILGVGLMTWRRDLDTACAIIATPSSSSSSSSTASFGGSPGGGTLGYGSLGGGTTPFHAHSTSVSDASRHANTSHSITSLVALCHRKHCSQITPAHSSHLRDSGLSTGGTLNYGGTMSGEEGVCDPGIVTALVDLTAMFVEKHLDVLVSSHSVYTQMRARTSTFIAETFVNLSEGVSLIPFFFGLRFFSGLTLC